MIALFSAANMDMFREKMDQLQLLRGVHQQLIGIWLYRSIVQFSSNMFKHILCNQHNMVHGLLDVVQPRSTGDYSEEIKVFMGLNQETTNMICFEDMAWIDLGTCWSSPNQKETRQDNPDFAGICQKDWILGERSYWSTFSKHYHKWQVVK